MEKLLKLMFTKRKRAESASDSIPRLTPAVERLPRGFVDIEKTEEGLTALKAGQEVCVVGLNSLDEIERVQGRLGVDVVKESTSTTNTAGRLKYRMDYIFRFGSGSTLYIPADLAGQPRFRVGVKS